MAAKVPSDWFRAATDNLRLTALTAVEIAETLLP